MTEHLLDGQQRPSSCINSEGKCQEMAWDVGFQRVFECLLEFTAGEIQRW